MKTVLYVVGEYVDKTPRLVGRGVVAATRYVMGHRIAFSSAAVLLMAVAVALIAPASDANADETGLADPKSVAKGIMSESNMMSSCQFLTFCRWGWSTHFLPAPSNGLTSIGQISVTMPITFAQVFFMIAATIISVIGLIMLLQAHLDIAHQFTYAADYIFADFTNKLIFNRGGGESAVFMLMTIMALIALVGWIFFTVTRNSVMRGTIMRKVAVSLLAFTAITLVGIQAQYNHKNMGVDQSRLAPIAHSATSGYSGGKQQDLNVFNDNNAEAGNIQSWRFGSPGWFVAVVDNGVGYAADLLGSLGAKMEDMSNIGSTEVRDNSTSSQSTCTAYIHGMHEVFENKFERNASKRTVSKLLVQYDKIASSIYFDTWRVAAYGDTQSANNAWCRSAEIQAGKSAAEQIVLSRQAGLYGEAIGYGSLGFQGSSKNYVDEKGITYSVSDVNKFSSSSIVRPDGTWTDADASPHIANNIFGPNYRNDGVEGVDGSGQTKASFVWAICKWRAGQPVQINSEWNGVKLADSDETWENNKEKQGICVKALSDTESIDIADTFWKQFFGTGSGATIKGGKAFGDTKDAGKEFNYFEDAGYAGGMLFGFGATSQYDKLWQSDAALDYYNHINASSPSKMFLTSVIPLVLTIMMAKYFGGVLLGGFIAEFSASMLLLVSFLFLFVYVAPSTRIRKIGHAIFLSILAAYTTLLLYVAVVTMIFATTNIFQSLFKSNIPGGVDIVSAAVNGAAILLAFIVWHQILKKFKIDSFNGMNAMTTASISPILRSAGRDAQSPWQADFYKQFVGEGAPSSRTKANVGTDSKTADGNAAKRFMGTAFDNVKKNVDPETKLGKTMGMASKLKNTGDALKSGNVAQAAAGKMGEGIAQNANERHNLAAFRDQMKRDDFKGVTRNTDGSFFDAKGDEITDPRKIAFLKKNLEKIALNDAVNPDNVNAGKVVDKFQPKLGENDPSMQNQIIKPSEAMLKVDSNENKYITGLNPITKDANGEDRVFGVNSSGEATPMSAEEIRKTMGTMAGTALAGNIIDKDASKIERAEALANAAGPEGRYAGNRLSESMAEKGMSSKVDRVIASMDPEQLSTMRDHAARFAGVDPSQIGDKDLRQFAGMVTNEKSRQALVNGKIDSSLDKFSPAQVDDLRQKVSNMTGSPVESISPKDAVEFARTNIKSNPSLASSLGVELDTGILDQANDQIKAVSRASLGEIANIGQSIGQADMSGMVSSALLGAGGGAVAGVAASRMFSGADQSELDHMRQRIMEMEQDERVHDYIRDDANLKEYAAAAIERDPRVIDEIKAPMDKDVRKEFMNREIDSDRTIESTLAEIRDAIHNGPRTERSAFSREASEFFRSADNDLSRKLSEWSAHSLGAQSQANREFINNMNDSMYRTIMNADRKPDYVNDSMWREISSLRSWIEDNRSATPGTTNVNISDIGTWPKERQVEFVRVADSMSTMFHQRETSTDDFITPGRMNDIPAVRAIKSLIERRRRLRGQ